MQFYIKESTIKNAGMGVFSAITIPKNTLLGKYEGFGINQEELDKEYGDNLAPFVLKIICKSKNTCKLINHEKNHEWYIDGSKNGNIFAYINDGIHSGLQCNVEFDDEGFVISTKKILPHQELFVDYGPNYWISSSA